MIKKIEIVDGKLKHYILGDEKTKLVEIPEGVTEICDGAFDTDEIEDELDELEVIDLENWDIYCQIETIKIPKTVKKVQAGAFAGIPNLNSFEVDKDCECVCVYDGMLFSKDMDTLICVPESKEGRIMIPEGVKIIGKKAFAWHCGDILDIYIPDSVKKIEDGAFYECCAEQITMEKNVPEIGKEVYEGFEGKIIIEGADCTQRG